MAVIKKIDYFKRLRKHLAIGETERKCRKEIQDIRSGYTTSKSGEVLLLPLMDDEGTMKVINEIGYRYASENNLCVRFFFVHSSIDNKYTYRTTISQLAGYFEKWNMFSLRRLRYKYAVPKNDVLITNHFAATTANTTITSKQSLLELQRNGITDGDLIYDTYLRFRQRATADLADPDLGIVIGYADQLAKKWERFLGSANVAALIMPYTAYMHWGIPARMALRYSIPVITFGLPLFVVNKLEERYPFHSKDFHLYRHLFQKLNNQSARLELATGMLNERLKGVIDKGTAYMKSSAYNNESGEKFEQPTGKWAVIFLHCFFDSPHIYGEGLFPDFFEWLTHLLNRASQNPGVTFYIKPHPNGLPGNEEIVAAFEKQFAAYPNIKFISAKISNGVIAGYKPDAAFTYYGTVGHEYAYLGIPVVMAGDNPHSLFSFVYHPASVAELDGLIQGVGKYGLPPGYVKEEISQFFYMHNLYFSEKYDVRNCEYKKDLNKGTFSVSANDTIKNLSYGPVE